jgi:hypothetical protein
MFGPIEAFARIRITKKRENLIVIILIYSGLLTEIHSFGVL